MITKEEYQKTLIRMWDSVRDNCLGKTDCDGVSCSECPLYSKSVCGTNARYNVYDLISLVENWGKEHPIVTNGSIYLKNFPKAKVLGTTNRATVGYNVRVVLDNSKPADENNVIEVPAEWWNEEVK